MKKIYSLVDCHFGVVLASSKTRRALEEYLLDIFMDEFREECQVALEEERIKNVKDPSYDDRQTVQEIWDRLINWYKSVYAIEKSYII